MQARPLRRLKTVNTKAFLCGFLGDFMPLWL
jgi:hypothetical protein